MAKGVKSREEELQGGSEGLGDVQLVEFVLDCVGKAIPCLLGRLKLLTKPHGRHHKVKGVFGLMRERKEERK